MFTSSPALTVFFLFFLFFVVVVVCLLLFSLVSSAFWRIKMYMYLVDDPTTTTVVSPEPFPHRSRALRSLWKSYRHWSVLLYYMWDPNDVPYRRILPFSKLNGAWSVLASLCCYCFLFSAALCVLINEWMNELPAGWPNAGLNRIYYKHEEELGRSVFRIYTHSPHACRGRGTHASDKMASPMVMVRSPPGPGRAGPLCYGMPGLRDRPGDDDRRWRTKWL